MMKRLIMAAGAALLALPGPCGAEDITLSTDYPSPVGSYDSLNVTDSLNVADAQFSGDLNIRGDGGGEPVAARGGLLTTIGDLDIRDAAGTSLLFVDARLQRVGIGTTTPQSTLDVRGAVKAIILNARNDPDTNRAGYIELFALSQGAVGNNFAHVDTVCDSGGLLPPPQPLRGQKYDFLPTYIDGNPLVMQSFAKPGVPLVYGQGRGQLVIKGDPDTNAAHNAAFVAGQAAGGKVLAFAIPGSSALYKREIRILDRAEYAEALFQVVNTPLFEYRMKNGPPSDTRQIGFISEESPEVMRWGDQFELTTAVGSLLAAAKALEMENRVLRGRIEALETDR